MKDRAWDIAGALTGIVFVVLMFVSMAVAGDPDLEPGDPSAKIATVLAIRSDKVETASMIGLVGLAFFFGFLGYFRRRLQQAEGEGGWLAEVAYGGGLVTATMLLVLLSMQLATTSVSGHQDTQVAKVFVVYGWNYVMVFAPPMIAFTLGASLIIVRYAALPRWTGWLGFLVALSLLMPWIGMVLATAWVLLVSVVLVIQASRTPRPESPDYAPSDPSAGLQSPAGPMPPAGGA